LCSEASQPREASLIAQRQENPQTFAVQGPHWRVSAFAQCDDPQADQFNA
jgi:hypothetical protein